MSKMRATYLASAMALSLTTAQAADKPKPAIEWFTYMHDSQTCKHLLTPAGVISHVRADYSQEPTVNDETDDNGRVTATVIQWASPIPGKFWTTEMFRAKADCEAYSADQRIDTKKYE